MRTSDWKGGPYMMTVLHVDGASCSGLVVWLDFYFRFID
jgi:hypothetical protein